MKVLVLSDDGVPSGYGRISMEVNKRLVQRGVEVMAASIAYDGLMPAGYEGQALPYWVGSLGGHADWPIKFEAMVNGYQPDIVMVVQDAPYAEAVRQSRIDWSVFGFVVVTPVDGAPVFPRWVNMLKEADATLTISEFGQQSHAKQGVQSALLRPGVDLNQLYALTDDEKKALRDKLNIPHDAFVLATMAQNQGRKMIPAMLQGFFKLAEQRPNVRYMLDMDKASPAGWDIPAMCQQFGWDVGKLIFREDAQRAGLTTLRERYNLADAHVVLAHREGWGLPLVEAMACGVVSMALDYSSGTEICGGGRGVLVKPLDYTSVSTWGNAIDKHPDMSDFVQSLLMLHDEPDKRRLIAKAGQEWARTVPSWDAAADAVHTALRGVYATKRKGGAA